MKTFGGAVRDGRGGSFGGCWEEEDGCFFFTLLLRVKKPMVKGARGSCPGPGRRGGREDE